MPRNIGMPDNLLYKLLLRSRKYTRSRITRQDEQQLPALRGDATHLARRQVAYRLIRMAAIRTECLVTASGRYGQLRITADKGPSAATCPSPLEPSKTRLRHTPHADSFRHASPGMIRFMNPSKSGTVNAVSP